MTPSNIGDITGKIALITGASSGLGRAIAETYAAAGAFIVSADLTPGPPVAPIYAAEQRGSGLDIITPTVDLLNEKFPSTRTEPRSVFAKTNVGDPASVKAAIDLTVKTYGRLDILVNNAGVSSIIHSEAFKSGSECRLHEVPDSVFERDTSINGHGVWNGIKQAIPQMLKQDPHPSGDRGWIVTISSVMATVALPGTASYCATKSIGLALTKAAALDYAKDKIHVNCITPGWIDTAMLDPMKAMGRDSRRAWIEGLHPWGRMAQPSDVASMALFLAGPGAAFCTGQAFVVDGGYTTL